PPGRCPASAGGRGRRGRRRGAPCRARPGQALPCGEQRLHESRWSRPLAHVSLIAQETQSWSEAVDIRGMSRARLVPTLCLLAVAGPIALVGRDGSPPEAMTATAHFSLVGGAAGFTSLASLMLSLAGARARDGRTILMGTAFSTMTAL